MATGVSGSGLTRIGKIVESMGKAATPEWRRALNKNIAIEARSQVVGCFNLSRDPYGQPWKPALRGGMTLKNTARLQNSIVVRALTQQGFSLDTRVIYAAIHNYGGIIRAKTDKGLFFSIQTGNRFAHARNSGKRLKKAIAVKQMVRVMQVVMPKRQFFPDAARGLGKWERPMMQAAAIFIGVSINHKP
jgi:phage gpG-like protein